MVGTYIYIYVSKYMCTYVCVYVCTYACVYMCTYVSIHIRATYMAWNYSQWKNLLPHRKCITNSVSWTTEVTCHWTRQGYDYECWKYKNKSEWPYCIRYEIPFYSETLRWCVRIQHDATILVPTYSIFMLSSVGRGLTTRLISIPRYTNTCL